MIAATDGLAKGLENSAAAGDDGSRRLNG